MKLKIHIIKQNNDFVATYSRNKFKSLEWKNGTLTAKEFSCIMNIVPMDLKFLNAFTIEWSGKIQYEKVVQATKSKSLFKELLDLYHEWYYHDTGIKPKIDGVTGKHLKQLIAYLRSQANDDSEVIVVFNLILSSWNSLPEFYRNQRELRQINSNINIILNTIKNGKSDSKTQAKHVSDAFRQSF